MATTPCATPVVIASKSSAKNNSQNEEERLPTSPSDRGVPQQQDTKLEGDDALSMYLNSILQNLERMNALVPNLAEAIHEARQEVMHGSKESGEDL